MLVTDLGDGKFCDDRFTSFKHFNIIPLKRHQYDIGNNIMSLT